MSETQTYDDELRAASHAVPDVLLTFGRVLEETGHLEDGWAYFLEKSWKWERVYACWKRHGEPYLGEAGWDAFADEAVAL